MSPTDTVRLEIKKNKKGITSHAEIQISCQCMTQVASSGKIAELSVYDGDLAGRQ